MSDNTLTPDSILPFLRARDYVFVKELGQGACGKTVLIHDDIIDEHFVCKKYAPYSETMRTHLFENFLREIKLLHRVHHDNVVRLFNYYIYREKCAGYILMEYVQGVVISEYVKRTSSSLSDLFTQAISGFAHLQERGILHRDIRPDNLMVTDAGKLKIIDLGFGKQIDTTEDFDKSVSLNWWGESPEEFANKKYDFATEVYFVGKLFERLLSDYKVSDFKYSELLAKMCERRPSVRVPNFAAVEREVRGKRLLAVDFSHDELGAYQTFSKALRASVTKIERRCKYITDLNTVRSHLQEVYDRVMLHEFVPDGTAVIRCFLAGEYYYSRNARFYVSALRAFINFILAIDDTKARIVLANLHSSFDAITRYEKEHDLNADNIPF